MTIKNIFYTVSDLARDAGKVLTVDMFNRYAPLAQLEKAEDLYQKMKDAESKGENNELRRDLLPFRGSSAGSLTSVTTYCTFAIPSDLWQVDSLTAAGSLVEFVSPAEAEERNDNAVTAPTSSLPIGVFDIGYFFIYPDISGAAYLTYWKYLASNEEPKIVMTSSNGVDIVDAGSSVDFILKSRYHSDIIMRILSYLHVPISKENALQYIEAKQEA